MGMSARDGFFNLKIVPNFISRTPCFKEYLEQIFRFSKI